ncbi:hypothetical protein RIF29_09966 [Crotalaria pallida]|uniref:Uncharacterized protein n=1 Tax=Crotalaria pallida TaxID=3830 RepID=A0AAN9ILP6_CROPI
MGRKRGRPPKTPSSSVKKTPTKQAIDVDNQVNVDLSVSDEETLEDLENLTPKKAVVFLRNLDTLRERLLSKLQIGDSLDNSDMPQAKNKADEISQNRKGEGDHNVKQPSESGELELDSGLAISGNLLHEQFYFRP